MVMGYMCETHGYQSECDVAKSGQRICYECGMAVTGVTGHTRGNRAPPTNEPMMQSGSIQWLVGGYKVNLRVNAFDYRDALQKAIEQVDNPQDINEVMPAKLEYRR